MNRLAQEMEYYEGKPNRRVRISDLKGTFGIDSHGHSGKVMASWQYVPEADEEDARVNTDGVWSDTPERWCIPHNDPRSKRKAKFFGTVSRGSFVPLEEIEGYLFEPDWFESEEPAPTKVPDLTKAVTELLTMNPLMVREIYERAIEPEEWPHDRVAHQPILASLVEAMRLLDENIRARIKPIVTFLPENPAKKYMLAVLG